MCDFWMYSSIWVYRFVRVEIHDILHMTSLGSAVHIFTVPLALSHSAIKIYVHQMLMYSVHLIRNERQFCNIRIHFFTLKYPFEGEFFAVEVQTISYTCILTN